MSYFSKFPLQEYDATGTGDSYVVTTNLTKRAGIKAKAVLNATYFKVYNVLDGETPESIAFDQYRDPTLHWVILLTNNIMDRFYDWPMPYQQFLNFVNAKYTNVNAVHHYEISQSSGDTSKKISIGKDNTDYPRATLITNFEYEDTRQDELRKIKLLKIEYISQVVQELENIMAGR